MDWAPRRTDQAPRDIRPAGLLVALSLPSRQYTRAIVGVELRMLPSSSATRK